MQNILTHVGEMVDSNVDVTLFSRDRPVVVWDVKCYVCGEEDGITILPVVR